VNAGRLVVLAVSLWLLGRDLISIVIISVSTMLLGERLLFVLTARRARVGANLGAGKPDENTRRYAAAPGGPLFGLSYISGPQIESRARTALMLGRPRAGRPLRFAVVCTDLDWQPWQHSAVEHLTRLGRGQLVQIVRVEAAPSWPEIPSVGGDMVPSAAKSNLEPTGVLECCGGHDGQGCWDLPAADVTAIEALGLDFILLFGMQRCRGSLLDVARHGVWAFAGFGVDRNAYAGPAFWPVFRNDDVTSVALVRLGRRAGEDAVLKRGTLRTKRTYRSNLNNVCGTISEWPAAVATMLVTGCALPSETFSAAEWADVVRAPTALQHAMFALRYGAQLLYKLNGFASCFDEWHLGVARCDMRHILEHGLPEDIEWAPAAGFGRFWADPMALEMGAQTKVLFERFSYWSNKGDIRAITYSPEKGWCAQAERFLDEPFHLSYPIVCDMGDGKVCIPESTEAGVTFAYRLNARGNPSGERTEFAGFAIADPTLIEHEGRWYLFGATAAEAQHTLRIWYADRLAGPWTAHPANPVKCDVRTARPAGPFVRLDGRLYRPSQNSSQSYGSSANLMEILELSPTAFCEVITRTIEPSANWPYPHGIHTLSPMRQGILIDAKVVRRSFFAPLVRTINMAQALRRNRAVAMANARRQLVTKEHNHMRSG
jgi:hypothetical protein